MRNYARLAITAIALTGSSMAMAWTYYSTTDNRAAPTISAPNVETSLEYFIPSSPMATTAVITGIQYSYGTYSNGATSQTVKLCRAPLNTVNWVCVDISGNPATTVSAFQNESSLAKYKMTFTLQGGTYPATGGFNNMIKVGWRY